MAERLSIGTKVGTTLALRTALSDLGVLLGERRLLDKPFVSLYVGPAEP